MNKNLKKLGLLVVTAIAMAMGVNSASALKIGNTDIASNTEIRDSEIVGVGSTVSVSVVNGVYEITLNGDFDSDIQVNSNDYVTINLNGHTLTGNVWNYGHLTLDGMVANSKMTGALQNNSTGYITINGGNYAVVTYTAGGKELNINTVYGTLVPTAMLKNPTYDKDYAKFVERNGGYQEMVEADAKTALLRHLLQAKSTAYPDIKYTGEAVMNNEAAYTKASFAVFAEAYNKAMALLAEKNIPVSRQGEVDAAAAAYIAAFRGRKVLATDSYDYLNSTLDKVNNTLADAKKKGIVYTDAILEKLNAAIAKATADMDLAADYNKSNSSLNKMIDEILAIYGTLYLNHKADYSQVDALEALIASIGKDNFTPETWAVYEFAQDFDRDMTEANQADVDKYYAKLYAAAKGLDLVKNTGSTVTPGDDEPSNPGTTEPSNPGTTTPGTTDPSTTEGGNNNSGTTVNPNTGATGTTSDVNTSDNAAVYAVMNIASLIALAGCGLVLRKQN